MVFKVVWCTLPFTLVDMTRIGIGLACIIRKTATIYKHYHVFRKVNLFPLTEVRRYISAEKRDRSVEIICTWIGSAEGTSRILFGGI